MRRLDDDGYSYGSYSKNTGELIYGADRTKGNTADIRPITGERRPVGGNTQRMSGSAGTRRPADGARRPEGGGPSSRSGTNSRVRISSDPGRSRKADSGKTGVRRSPSGGDSVTRQTRASSRSTATSPGVKPTRRSDEEIRRDRMERRSKDVQQTRQVRSREAAAQERRASYEARNARSYDFDGEDFENEKTSRKRPAKEKKYNAAKSYSKAPVVAILIACLVIAAGIGFVVFGKLNLGKFTAKASDVVSSESIEELNTQAPEGTEETQAAEVVEEVPQDSLESILYKASIQSAMYDYDTAIATLQSYNGGDYANEPQITEAIANCEASKAMCVEYPVEMVTHVFFHALLYEPEVSFSEISPQVDGFNVYMTTVDEFNKMLQSMYDKGFVLVSLYDIAQEGADGTYEAGHIYLPEGKKGLIISEDDVNYYHNYANGGIADKLLIDENGKVKTQYTYQDGTVEIGNHDVIPIVDAFVEEHPDFSYRGAKGAIALTGYNGILGYRTDPTYSDELIADRDGQQQAWLDEHPDFNFEAECAEASRVAQAIKDDGWIIASHSWGHMWQDKLGIDGFIADTDRWMTRVAPLIGGTDTWIYSNGEDVDQDKWQDRFQYLLANGFRYFCPVNSMQYSVRIDSYGLNMGRRNLDGYRMYYDMIDDEIDRLSDLFDVNEVFDWRRPTPVPEI